MHELEIFQLFSTIPATERHKLVEVLHPVDHPARAILCRESDPGDSLYLILSGQVEVIKALGAPEERLLRVINAGDYVGEMSLLERHGRRTASLRCATPVRLLELTRADFDQLINLYPTLAMEMLRELSLRLRDTQSATIRDLQSKNIQLAQAYQELQEAQNQLIEKERLERELQLAHQIQMSMLPSTLPHTRGFEFGATILPARAVGGDLYDFVSFSDGGEVGILVGDVSDKGVPAALFMALTRSLLRAVAAPGVPPVEVLKQINRHMLEMNRMNMFVTMIYGVLIPATGEFTYARGGHEIPILVTENGESIEVLYNPGQIIGIFSQPLIDEQCLTIPPGGILLLFTDGASDANNAANEFFGSERLLQSLINNRQGTAQEVCDKVFADLLKFQGAAPQIDDITLLVIKSCQ
ncbi:MAG: SpoIIE family protein phosphatase [Anaerolineales bacterium]|nr:SpoIIE family protein phosphatase [Anaerolineales bacterium]